ncbi:MAG: universal stress protein [Nitrolancea sp.]
MSLFGTILVPHDGSTLADSALPFAAELARATGATLELMRVLEELRPIYDTAGHQLIWIDPANPRAELASPALLGEAAKRLASNGIQSKMVVRVGDPRHEILAEAKTLDRPLILIASHGRGGLSRMVMGSVATRVLQLSHCPVMLVKASKADDQPDQVLLRRISVPLDGSDLAEKSLPYAMELAGELGARVHLVRVAETFRDEVPQTPSHIFTSPSYRAMLDQFEQLEQEAQRYLDDMATRLGSEDVDVTWEVLSGDPWRQLLRYVERDDPDLIVMTTHGRGGLARWFYGSVSDRLLTAASTPLLVIRSATPEE